MKKRREQKAQKQRGLNLVSPPFRLRAITLALLAAAAGVLALVIALTPAEQPTFYVLRTARPEPAWPEGFVELDPAAWASARRSAEPAPSASATPATPSASSTARPSPE